ncbi:CYTH and CHAD domain-containing protein [Nonomuraea sp. NPDC026600]|uniref:CYTH and CHAD domain-containing protein n=1 Tax=Nonomuraea sp. NPDC026600 TaxID=3155363 RepID=UPI0033E4F577
MTTHVEIERKYDVDGGAEITIEGFTGPDGEVTADEPETWQLVAEYVDTAALTLAAHGITLRRRQGGADAGWHLKLPMAKGARREVHAPLGADVHHIPAQLAELVAAHVRGHELVPVVVLETTRTVRRLHDHGGKVLAEVADDQVVGRRLGRDRRPASWREIEVELVDGSTGLLDAVESRLRAAGATPSPSVSKLARVLGDDLPPAADRGSGRSAGAALVAYLRRQREQLLGNDPLVRLADHDDDTVHQMRVAVRRIRSVLRTHSRLLDGDRVAPLEAELRWLAGELGTVRDLEVLTARFDQRLTGRPQDGPRNARWPALLAARERKARQVLKRTLGAPRYLTLLAAVDDFIADPPFQDRAGRKASRQTPRLVARSWRKVLTRYTEAQKLPEGAERDRALHSTRKAAKRARYTAEAAAPVLGIPAKKLAKQAERLQETLGRRQDALVAQQELTQLATRPGLRVADAFTLGLLLADERHAADAALRDLAPVWKKAAKPGLLKALNA